MLELDNDRDLAQWSAALNYARTKSTGEVAMMTLISAAMMAFMFGLALYVGKTQGHYEEKITLGLGCLLMTLHIWHRTASVWFVLGERITGRK